MTEFGTACQYQQAGDSAINDIHSMIGNSYHVT